MTYGKREQLNTNQTTGAKCAVCQKNKFQLRNRKSKLNGQPMFVCNDCFTNKYEPRWLVIITAQDEGLSAVHDYLVNHKYVGTEIPAVDLVK
jgi:hypothetical protein